MAVIVDAVRTPRGKAKPGGGLASFTALDLTVTAIRALVDRTGIDPALIDDVIIGCATQTGEQGGNLARTAALLAGFGDGVPGATVNRFCASGLDSVNLAAAKVSSGGDDLVVAGGVESVSRVPMFSDGGPLYSDRRVAEATGFVHMGVAADLVATLEGSLRADLDEYAVRSHHRASRAWEEGVFLPSLVLPEDGAGDVPLTRDEHVRPGTTVEQLAAMEAAFAGAGDGPALAGHPHLERIEHLHTRGNSPALADGAGAVLVASEERAAELGLPMRARIVSSANRSVDPVIMLTAGQEAVAAAVDQAKMAMGDVDRFEFAEAFAALCLRFLRQPGVDPERFNVNGGTIAMGHAFGATGSILVATLLDEMERSDVETGVVGISGAAGLGVATVLVRA